MEEKVRKSTIAFNLFGLIMSITACVFIGLAIGDWLPMIRLGEIDEDTFIKMMSFLIIGIVCLVLCFMAFISEIYISLGKLEKAVYEQREN